MGGCDREQTMAADPVIDYTSRSQFVKLIARTEKEMHRAAKEMDFLDAARLRDELEILKKKLNSL